MDKTAHNHPIRHYFIGLFTTLAVVIIAVSSFVAIRIAIGEREDKDLQSQLAPFYESPAGWKSAEPGTVFRSESVDEVPDKARGWRILYRSERADGTPSVSGGLVFTPASAPPPEGRPVVAWAHGTLGMGDKCAPSRTEHAEKSVPGLELFLEQGWAVVATDYSGLGTAGIEEYLIGKAEAADVLYSVRAARSMNKVGASNRLGLWGHSQGGQSVLWSAALAPQITPELDLVGVAAAAPAAELPTLMHEQWDSPVGWAIGVEVLVAWPKVYPDLSTAELVSRSGRDYRKLAEDCITESAVETLLRERFLDQKLFKEDPTSLPSWKLAATENVPPISQVPTFIAQGLSDTVVLPGTTASWITNACAQGLDVTASWIGDLGHVKAGFSAAPEVSTWLQERFANAPTSNTCGTSPPVDPLTAE